MASNDNDIATTEATDVSVETTDLSLIKSDEGDIDFSSLTLGASQATLEDSYEALQKNALKALKEDDVLIKKLREAVENSSTTAEFKFPVVIDRDSTNAQNLIKALMADDMYESVYFVSYITVLAMKLKKQD